MICYIVYIHMKIKTLTLIGIIIASMVFIVSIYVNFDLVVNVRYYSDLNQRTVGELTEHRLKLDLPLELWLDVHNGTSHRPIEPIETQANEIITSMRNQITLFKSDLVDLNRISLNRHSITIELFQTELIQLDNALSNLIVQISNKDAVGTQNANNDINFRMDSIQDRYEDLNKDILNDLSLVINVNFVLLLIVLSILSFGMIRFVYFQIPYMVKGLTNLADKRYDAELQKPRPFFTEELDIHRYIDDLFEENQFIEEVREVLLNQYIVEDAMDRLFPLLKERMGINRIGLAFVDYPKNIIKAEYGVVDEGAILLGPGFEVSMNITTLKNVVSLKQAQITNDFLEELKLRPNSASLRLLNKEGMRSNLILPMTMGNAVFGFLFISSRHPNHFTSQHLHLGEKIVYEIKGLLNRSYFTKIVFNRITNGFSELVDKKDNETGDHILRMVRYSTLLARKLLERNLPDYPINERMILEIERSAAVHDIGKVGIPDAILKKPGKLTDEEWEIMRTHPQIGGDIFMSIREGLSVFDPELYKVSEEITRYHHEKWNGKGYPYGLKGQEIPLVARIVTVADVFDAISSKRVYKDAFGLEAAFELLQSMRGETLDPVLVDIFMQSRKEIILIQSDYE